MFSELEKQSSSGRDSPSFTYSPPEPQLHSPFSSPSLSGFGFISVFLAMSQQAGGFLPMRSKKEFSEMYFGFFLMLQVLAAIYRRRDVF